MTTERPISGCGAIVVALSCALTSTDALGFVEDVCFVAAPGGSIDVIGCLPVPDGCAGNTSESCQARAVAGVLAAQSQALDTAGMRSTLHVDATFVIAQALGFAPSAGAPRCSGSPPRSPGSRSCRACWC
jgi:hypothetical protein